MTTLTEKQKKEAAATTEAIAKLEAAIVQSSGIRRQTLEQQHDRLLQKAKAKAS